MGMSNWSDDKLSSEKGNLLKEIEMLEKSLECIPEGSILGYLSVTAGIAYRKKKLQLIKNEISSRNSVI